MAQKDNAKHVVILVLSMLFGNITEIKELIHPKSGSGNLSSFINNDYKSFKEWNNRKHEKTEDRVHAVELDNAVREGAETERRETRVTPRTSRRVHENTREDDWVSEFYPPQGIKLWRNMKTHKLYYDVGADRYQAKFNSQLKIYYYLSREQVKTKCPPNI